MICLLHGYLLDGSGSNLWTRSIVRALAREGVAVHLVCQEPHPETYDFIAQAVEYRPDGRTLTVLERRTAYPGRCVLHRPILGSTLPVYVWDEYEEFERVIPMTDMDDIALEDYLHRNFEVVSRVVRECGVTVMHANHALLMSVVAQRVSTWTGVPYAIMPHGSALEYAVRPDDRLRAVAADAFAHARRIFVISDEIATRAADIFGSDAGDLESRTERLDLGVDTSAFRPIAREQRHDNVGRVVELLRDVERGRTAGQRAALRAGMERGGGLQEAWRSVGDYVAKNPDADVESKLRTVDWETDDVIAFVGRLIPAKGIHALIAALPLVLAAAPRARLLVVGHGPLREPLESLVYALEHGDRALARRIIEEATRDDAGESGRPDAVLQFWRSLEDGGTADAYWDAAQRYLKSDTVVFTGYLTHREMSWLLPCCDVGVFPSMVVESGPLVFLESLASGVFPVGTYFGGMQVKIDRVAPALEEGHASLMKVRPDPEHIVADLASVLPDALPLGARYRATLRSVAERYYDWRPVALRLRALLDDVAAGAAVRH